MTTTAHHLQAPAENKPRARAFARVDVFSSTPYLGNPVAVILNGTACQTRRCNGWRGGRTCQKPPSFCHQPTPQRTTDCGSSPPGELPFAGHPTLGSAHAWLEHGGVPRGEKIVQQCAAGLVDVRRGDGILSFAAPPTRRSGDLTDDELSPLLAALGIDLEQVLAHQWVDNGPGWNVIRVATAEEVLALEPDLSLIPTAMTGVIGAYPEGSQYAFEMRTFAPAVGVAEDPVCGSMNASIGQWITGSGDVAESYRVSQGARLGRAGDITITADPGGTVWVGGGTTTCFTGTAQV